MSRWNKSSSRRKKQLVLHTVKRGFVSLFVCIIVLLPLYFMAAQILQFTGISLTGKHDKRSDTPLPAMQVRPQDKTSTAVMPFSQPYITVTFDDGWESVYTQAAPLLQKYGIPTTQYILSGIEDNQDYMSFGQIAQLKAGGHEIACHSVTHPDLTTLNHKDLIDQLTGCKKTLEKKLNTSIKDFASPYGSESADSVNGIKEVFRSERNTAGDITTNQADDHDINVASTFNQYGIIAVTIRKETTAAQLQAAIDYTIQHNGWLVLNYHQVENGDEEYGISMATLESQLKAINKAPVRIVTMGQFLDQYDKTVKNKETK